MKYVYVVALLEDSFWDQWSRLNTLEESRAFAIKQSLGLGYRSIISPIAIFKITEEKLLSRLNVAWGWWDPGDLVALYCGGKEYLPSV